MKRHTVEYLESVIKAYGIRKCAACGEYELPVDGTGGIQADVLGTDTRNGRLVHRRCLDK